MPHAIFFDKPKGDILSKIERLYIIPTHPKPRGFGQVILNYHWLGSGTFVQMLIPDIQKFLEEWASHSEGMPDLRYFIFRVRAEFNWVFRIEWARDIALFNGQGFKPLLMLVDQKKYREVLAEDFELDHAGFPPSEYEWNEFPRDDD